MEKLFTTTQLGLSLALAKVRPATTAKVLQVCEFVRFAKDGSGATITASDCEIFIECTCSGSWTSGREEFLVPFAELSRFVAHFDDMEYIEFHATGDTVQISAKGIAYSLSTLEADQFPVCKFDHTESIDFTLEGKDIAATKRATDFCSSEEYRPAMTCVNFDFSNTDHPGQLVIIATDGYKVYQKSTDVYSDCARSFLISATIVRAIPKTESITFMVNGAALSLQCNGFKLIGRITDEKFPDYRSVIPAKLGNHASFNAKAFTDSLSIAGLAITKAHVGTVLTFGEGSRISVNNTESGQQCTTQLESTDNMLGESLNIGFNFKYLQSAIGQVKTDNDTLTFQFESATRAVIIRTSADENLLTLVMPMRIVEPAAPKTRDEQAKEIAERASQPVTPDSEDLQEADVIEDEEEEENTSVYEIQTSDDLPF